MKLLALAPLLFIVPALACSAESTSAEDANDAIRAGAGAQKFVDHDDKLPADWQKYSKYQFKLSQDYPTSAPAKATLPWKKIDFKTDPDAYVLALRDYAMEGFIHPADPDSDFRGEFNTARRWFNVPWLDVGLRGREGLHGLTREKDAVPGRLCDTQKTIAQDWGIGFYNDIGGYTIGQVWKDPQHPDASKATFREGAVVFKALFTDADPKEVTWVADSVTWQANIRSDASLYSAKKIRPVRLAQMDIAVKDDRSPTSWVYTTLVFDPTAPTDAVRGAYGKMMPVGIAYGNDPGVAPGGKIVETVIAKKIPAAAQKTLGYGGRLNGPGDNPASACFSCHTTAEYPALSLMTPPAGADTATMLNWFRDPKPGEPFDAASKSLDTSLQLQISLVNFDNSHNKPKSPAQAQVDDPQR